MEDRYQRNILVEGIGVEGQARLSASKVLVIGAGGLGSPALFYLAAAGIGTIGIVDDDTVNLSNLQRQILHFTQDLGHRKTDSAKQKLSGLNPDIKVITYNCRFSKANAENIINGSLVDGNNGTVSERSRTVPAVEFMSLPDEMSNASSKNPVVDEYDFVIDCCDNFATKLLINDICVNMKKPYSHGAIIAMRGEVMTYTPGSACYRCVFETPPEDGILPTAAQAGVLGSVAGIVGSLQATEAIKYLVGMTDLITNRILIIDAQKTTFFSLNVHKRNSCIC